MKITGNTDEFIEMTELSYDSRSIFKNPEPSSLTILWFRADHNEFIIDGQTYAFSKNQIIFLTEFHKVTVNKKGETNYLRFNRPFYCIIDHDTEVSCKGVLFFGSSQLPIIQIPDEEIEHFETLWKMFTIEMKSKDNLQISMLQMMLKRYLILCTRLYKLQKQFPNEKNETDVIREFNFLVEQHFKTKHTVAEYADLLHKSPKTISNIFSKISPKSPLKYIQERIMLEAKRLLYYSDKPIKEIAYEIGYEDIQSFSRFFKNQEGSSPSKYREKTHSG
ncbi:AraC-like DNA-binding protein [Mariniflexile fucanivorans]|uniref:AraC-like DNA-binding protein n=1 Tax=Mariniflexile fucanivorans TaxID=264023 RepID=A0A4R1RA61_9FLAO|nr:helix-turn-helix domain-containing protein [Mariniflexile fucanivorans]TCL62634.1 AraC-like DNA-binding protein [Mariniflexile fucanivorans]